MFLCFSEENFFIIMLTMLLTVNVWVFCCYNSSEGIKTHCVSKEEFFSLFLSHIFSFMLVLGWWLWWCRGTSEHALGNLGLFGRTMRELCRMTCGPGLTTWSIDKWLAID